MLKGVGSVRSHTHRDDSEALKTVPGRVTASFGPIWLGEAFEPFSCVWDLQETVEKGG